MFAAQVRDGNAVRRAIDPLDRWLFRLTVLLQDADDLLFGKTATPHALVLELGQSELQTGLGLRGNVTGNSK